jgi:hypothetical protein
VLAFQPAGAGAARKMPPPRWRHRGVFAVATFPPPVCPQANYLHAIFAATLNYRTFDLC